MYANVAGGVTRDSGWVTFYVLAGCGPWCSDAQVKAPQRWQNLAPWQAHVLFISKGLYC